MAASETGQLTMDSILSDAPAEKPAEKVEQPLDIPVLGEQKPDAAAAEAADEQRKQDYKSKRQQARDKESIAQGKVRDPDTGQFVSPKDAPAVAAEKPAAEAATVSKPAATIAEELTPKERAAFAKAADETRKRQALEARLRELEAKVPQEPAKTFWDDPEAALNKQKQEIQQAVVGMRLQTAEGIARSRYKDFDEKVAVFSELAQSTPGLAQHMLAAADPAEFVYRTAANHMAIRDAGGIDQLRAKIEAETTARVRAELEKELTDKAAALAKERAALPGSLSDAPSKGGQNRVVWSGPSSMNSILNDK